MFPFFRQSVKLLVKVRQSNNFAFSRCLVCRPDFTKNAYNVSRGNYNYLQEGHVNYFQHLLGDDRVIMDLSDLEKYNVDWYLQVRGSSAIVLKPKTNEEVSKILLFCDNNRLAVCPQGGNTSVVGGSVPVFDEVIISMELMNKIISLDETSGVIVCEAGCILENLDNYLSERGLIVPLDLGSKGSCQIGGNVATNAGGMRLLRYGSMHANVLGLEVVKANGEILDCLSTLKKNNTGYHLKHLFIGSEGTLGIITKVAIHCQPRPKYRSLAFLGLQDFDKVLNTFKKAKQDIGEILSAVEVLDNPTMKFINERNHQQSPIGSYPFYLMIEVAGTDESHDNEKLQRFLETGLSSNLILNGLVASDPTKINAIWGLRENISEGYKTCGAVFYYDVSLPLEHYYTLVDDMRSRMGNRCERVFGYGHLGDSNLHLQIQMKEYSQELRALAEPYIYKRTAELKGSISAEHGMGFMKRNYLKLAKSSSYVSQMRDLKRIFDPNEILNPYTIFP